MQAQTTYSGSPEDLAAMLTSVLNPFVERIRELEIAAGSTKHLYTVKEAGERIGYCAHSVRQFIREGKPNAKGKTVYLKATEITKGDFRIRPCHLDEFISQFKV